MVENKNVILNYFSKWGSELSVIKKVIALPLPYPIFPQF